MKFVLFFGVCLVFFILVKLFVEDEFVEDEEDEENEFCYYLCKVS